MANLCDKKIIRMLVCLPLMWVPAGYAAEVLKQPLDHQILKQLKAAVTGDKEEDRIIDPISLEDFKDILGKPAYIAAAVIGPRQYQFYGASNLFEWLVLSRGFTTPLNAPIHQLRVYEYGHNDRVPFNDRFRLDKVLNSPSLENIKAYAHYLALKERRLSPERPVDSISRVAKMNYARAIEAFEEGDYQGAEHFFGKIVLYAQDAVKYQLSDIEAKRLINDARLAFFIYIAHPHARDEEVTPIDRKTAIDGLLSIPLQSSLEIAPEALPDLYLELALVYKKGTFGVPKNAQRAQEYFERALSLPHTDPEFRQAVHELRNAP